MEVAIIALSVGLILAPVWQSLPSGAALGRILAFTLINLVMSFILIIRQLRNAPFNINKTYWRYALTYAVPILPHVVANVALTQFDRVMIDAYIGRSEAGIYSFAYQLGSITTMVWLAINTAWTPWFYRRMEIGDVSAIRLRARQYLWLFTALTVGLILVVQPLVQLFAPPQYQAATGLIPIILGGGYFQMLYSFAWWQKLITRK
jgi:O-antigen/teichoic acid export membrane protein